MNIPLNKDLEEYKNELVWGFDFAEIGFIVAGVLFGGGVGFLVYQLFHVNPVVCVYTAIPFAMPIIFLGLWKIRGMSVFKYQKERRYQRQTHGLLYEANELPEEIYVWSMNKAKHNTEEKRR